VYGPPYYGSPQDPDYSQFSISGAFPVTIPPVIGVGLNLTFTGDRYGDNLVGIGPIVGMPGVSVSDTKGWIGSNADNSYPSKSGSQCGFGITYSPGSNTGKWGSEQGLYSPQYGISYVHSWLFP
jgi:hypothetical protein